MPEKVHKELITSKGAKLHYMMIRGEGETPLVLIHGQCMCCEDYGKVFDKLSEKYALYVVDCFGHGDSGKDKSLYRCNVIGDAVAELINEIGTPCVLSGHLSGGHTGGVYGGSHSAVGERTAVRGPSLLQRPPRGI